MNENNITGQSPEFTNISIGDFSLQPDSPAINSGHVMINTGGTPSIGMDLGAYQTVDPQTGGTSQIIIVG